MSAIEQLEPAWADAFLQRSRFLDADFQGDVLAVISSSTTSLVKFRKLMRCIRSDVNGSAYWASTTPGHAMPTSRPVHATLQARYYSPARRRYYHTSKRPDARPTSGRAIHVSPSVPAFLLATSCLLPCQDLHGRSNARLSHRHNPRQAHALGQGARGRDIPYFWPRA
jgi:hypothetical protein